MTKETADFTAEQLIAEAFKFHSQGNISEAAKYYQLFLDKGFSDVRVFSNYGAIYQQAGQPEQAIKLNPNHADAHANLGGILSDLGKLEEAELSQRKAIELNPKHANAHSNLGVILRDLGKLQEAELSSRKAIEIKPDLANAHYNLGRVFNDLKKLDNAL